MKRKILALLLSALLLLLMAACGNSQEASNNPPPASGPDQSGGKPAASESKDTLNIAITADEGTLAIEYCTSGLYSAMAVVMEPLWDVDEEGNIIWTLAESVETPAEDRLIVHLRKDVKFSNGNPLTAEDVLFSIGLYKKAGVTGSARVQVIDPERTTAIDDYTVNLQMFEPNVAQWQILSQFFIYDKESYDEATAATKPIGTGPYVVTEYVPNSHVKLERNENYWGKAPEFKYLNFSVLAEPSQRVNALVTGMVDIAPLALEDVEYVRQLSGFNVDTRRTGYYLGLSFNLGAKSFFYHNLEARKAVVHAVQPEAIKNVVYLGLGEVMHAAVPDICFDFEERFNNMDDTYKIGYNPQLAKDLAEESGLSGQTVSLITNGTPEQIKAAEMIQSMLKEINVNVEINNYDPATAWQLAYDPEADYDMSILSGITPNRVVGDQLVNGVRYSPTLTIPGAFENNEEYLARAPLTLSTLDDAKRSELLYELLAEYESNVITYGLVNYLVANAFTKAINPDSIIYSVGTGFIRFQDLTKG